MYKICKKCNNSKLLECFGKAPTNNDGYQHSCKECLYKIYKQRYFNTNVYRNKNAERNRIKYQNDEIFKEKQLLNHKKFLAKNPNYHTNYNKIYNEKNREKINAKQRNKKEYNNNKAKEYRKDPTVRLKESLRWRLNAIVKKKSKSSIKYLGCSMIEYIKYIESKFTPQMNWDNYGKNKYWEIDHIIAISKFDLTKEEEIHKAFHYTNTQPLSITENRRKNDK